MSKQLGAFTVPVIAGDAASPANGDIWYNSSTGKFRKRENGATSDMDTVGGGTTSILGYVAKTANYTVTTSDYLIDCTSNSFTITLPTAVGITGQRFVVKNTGTGVITLATTSSQTMDGYASAGLNLANKQSYTFISDGANWKIENLVKTKVPLATGVVSAASAIDIDLSSFYNIYEHFEIEFYHLYPATNGAALWVRVSPDGSSYDAGSTDYSWTEGYSVDNAGNGGGGSPTAAQGVVTADGTNVQADAGTLSIKFSGISNATYKAHLMCLGTFTKRADYGGNRVTSRFGIVRNTAQLTKGVRVLAASGNISGEWTLFGSLK